MEVQYKCYKEAKHRWIVEVWIAGKMLAHVQKTRKEFEEFLAIVNPPRPNKGMISMLDEARR